MEKGLVSVDRWDEGCQAYFLTHLHADHTKGLSSKWSRGTLFCSSISAILLPSKFPKINVSLISVLEVGITQIILLRSPSSGSEVRLHVTPIDAHHCPGAVMYLFRGEFGCVLHTGDFRWEIMNERAAMARSTLMNALDGHKVDILYFDNTYCHPLFSFPTRETATQQVMDIVNSNPDHEIVIGIYTLGKEDLLLHISQALGMKIWVWPERLKTMHLLGFGSNFTTNTTLTRVRAVPAYSLTHETLAALNTSHPTIGILPSGIPWLARYNGEDDGMADSLIAPRRKLNELIYFVQYSEHSCFSELREFIKLVQPLAISGLVSSSTYCINPGYYFSHLCRHHRFLDASRKEVRDEKGRDFKWKVKAAAGKKASGSSGRRGRVNIMRRGKFGSKIADYEESDALL